MDSRNIGNSRLRAFVATAAAVSALAFAAAAQAQPGPKEADAQPISGPISGIVQAEPAAGGSQTAAPAEVKPALYAGRAPYICSPSGFGERSKCFLRSSLRGRSR
ncbi:hypothetical protein [Phenylobacterium soli]